MEITVGHERRVKALGLSAEWYREVFDRLGGRCERCGKQESVLFFSQEAFADHCGLHRTAISLIERGKRVPSLTTLLTISGGFGVTVSELLRGVDTGYKRKAGRLRHAMGSLRGAIRG